MTVNHARANPYRAWSGTPVATREEAAVRDGCTIEFGQISGCTDQM